MDNKFSLIDFPDDPSKVDWNKEAMLLFAYMLTQEEKFNSRIKHLLEKFQKDYKAIKDNDSPKKKSLFYNLKQEIFKIKGKDSSVMRSIAFIILVSTTLNKLENSLTEISVKEKSIEILKNLIPGTKSEKDLEEIAEAEIKAVTKSINELIRITRTEYARKINAERLEEFRRKGYKYKSTYPVKDNRTGDDSWFYYGQRQIKPINESFNYEWDGENRVFMHPPDRANDRNIIIPYVGDLDKYKNEIS